MVALNLVGFRDMTIFPFVSRISRCRFAFKSGIFAYDQPVNIGKHKRIFGAFVNDISSPHLFPRFFHETSGNIILQITSLPHGFIVLFLNRLAYFVLINRKRRGVGIQPTDGSGVTSTDTRFASLQPFFMGHIFGTNY